MHSLTILQALKATNLKIEELKGEARALRLEYAHLDRLVNKPAGKTKKPNVSASELDVHEEKIKLFGKKFGIMNEIFVPNTAFMVSNTNYDPTDPGRYKEPKSILNGIIAELFEEVPKEFHALVTETSFFRDTVSMFRGW